MLTTKPLKPKACKHCKSSFTPTKRLQVVCSPLCGLERARIQREAKERKEHAARKRVERAMDKKRKDAVKTHADWKAEAQKAVNDYVRLRDAHLPCISCGRFHEGAWHAGHFRSRGAAPQLALDPRNVHRQCAPCNLYLHGNQIAYRAGLVERYGLDYVLAIESENEPLKLTVEELKQIKTIYRAKARQLKKEKEA